MTVLDDDDYLDYNELMFPAYFGSQAQNIVSLGEVDYHSMEAISNGFRVDDHGIDYPSEVPSVPVRWERYLEYSAEHTSEEDAIDYYMNNSNDEEHTKIYDTDIHSSDENHALHFKLIYSDGGQFGSTYAVQNVLSNNTSVYCSGRKGVVNIVLEYNGYLKSGIRCDTSCTVSNLIIKVPAHGFTAPCRYTPHTLLI
ncbi:hypothetical protein BDB01DRAFT_812669 [Pilobolus umbonatus]|nr:hypothetical protein BDB01DRAFT_812669 [Pilobolus umbonatus]